MFDEIYDRCIHVTQDYKVIKNTDKIEIYYYTNIIVFNKAGVSVSNTRRGQTNYTYE